MNKKNKILVGCLALLLVLSVGYALFSEQVTINGTATAKGDFEITTTVADNMEIIGSDGEIGIVTDSNINVVDNVVTASAILGAPGSYKQFIIKIENTGTVPAILKSITDANGNVADKTSNWYGKYKCNDDNTSCVTIEIAPDTNYNDDYEDIGWFSSEWGPDEDVLFQAVLDPGESTHYYIDIYWGSKATSGEKMELSYTFKLNWEQVVTN